jgi:hypothetical protein
MVSHTNSDRKTAIKTANHSFQQSKILYEKKINPLPVLK